jgi:competence protein ComEC
VHFSTGYRNPFNPPHPSILQRYREGGAQVFNTADSGAVTWHLNADGLHKVTEWRRHQRRYWHSL